MPLGLIEALRAWRPTRPRPLPRAEHARLLAAARIERHGGLTALYLAGSPYEMGYQHGVLARDLIQDFRMAAYAYVDPLAPGPRWLARPALFLQAAAYWPTVSAELAEEMQGIADGAGVHPIEVLVSTAIWEMYLVSGCSEFAAVGPATADGLLLHAFNYDLMHPDHALIQPYVAALFYQPTEGIPFVTVSTVGSVGANARMNEAGITLAWDNTYLKDEELTQNVQQPVVPFVITQRKLLQHSRSLEEAVGTVTRSLPRPLADIVIVGSVKEARAVVLETAGRMHATREMQDGAVWSTNSFRSLELATNDRRGEATGLSEGEAWRRFPRYCAYSDLFSARRGHLSPSSAAAFLRDPYPREAEGYLHPFPAPRATICRDITSWSLVMAPGRGRLWVSDIELPGCQGRFFAFDLPAWQPSSEHDLAPPGYGAAQRCVQQFLAGDLAGAEAALAEAIGLDGPTAPLLLMGAVLSGLAGDDAGAAQRERQVAERWGKTPMGVLARTWLERQVVARPPAVPLPSAIRPLVRLQAGMAWEKRAVAWGVN